MYKLEKKLDNHISSIFSKNPRYSLVQKAYLRTSYPSILFMAIQKQFAVM